MPRFITFGLTILLAFASAALAVDGTVLINQSTITNGLTGCPTGGHFPIIICQSGSYRLSGNITVPDANTDAIHINADNVSLDLNGFAILGPATCQAGTFPVRCSATGFGFGIVSDNNNIGVSNGAVNGMGGAGIGLFGIGVRIDGLRVANNANAFEAAIQRELCRHNQLYGYNQRGGRYFPRGGNGEPEFYRLQWRQWNKSPSSVEGVTALKPGLVASNNTVFQNGQDGVNTVSLAVNNTIVDNVGFGFSCTSPGIACGFEGNVISNNSGGAVKGGTSLGHNLCNGSGC